MKNPANQISFLVHSSVALPSIRLTSLIIIVVVVIASTSSSVPLDTWRFPCSDGENHTVTLEDEFLNQVGQFEQEVRKSFEVKKAYEGLSEETNLLKEKMKRLTEEYFSVRFPGDDHEIYKGISIDVIPHFGREHHESFLRNDEELVDEAYENFARFSIYLYFALAGEEKEPLRIRFSDQYNAIHNNTGYGVASILCKLSHLTKFFGSDDKLIGKLEKLKVDSMPRYLEANAFQRHLMDYLILRQFKENLARISKYFILRSVTYNDDGQKSSGEVVKERTERHVTLEKSRREEREDELANVQMENLENVLKAKRERVKPRKKNKSSRRISRDQREYDILMRLI